MKKLPRDPEKFDVLQLFSSIGRVRGFQMGDPRSLDNFVETVRSAFLQHSSNPALVYGQRVQSLFGYVAACLPHCILVKTEDGGDVYVRGADVRVPDYRIVLHDRTQMLVEVKSLDDPLERVKFKKPYIAALREYAAMVGSPLKLALYWWRPNVWVLVDADRLRDDGECWSTSLIDANFVSEMGTLGDVSVFLQPPLTIRALDETSRALLAKSRPGTSPHLSVDDIQLLNAGRAIKLPLERSLAFLFLFYGTWRSGDLVYEKDDDGLTYVRMDLNPEVPDGDEDQPIHGIASLSGLISTRYRSSTSNGDSITLLAPGDEPESFLIPLDRSYRGQALKIWQMSQVVLLPPGPPDVRRDESGAFSVSLRKRPTIDAAMAATPTRRT
jgi:hypothetical protein